MRFQTPTARIAAVLITVLIAGSLSGCAVRKAPFSFIDVERVHISPEVKPRRPMLSNDLGSVAAAAGLIGAAVVVAINAPKEAKLDKHLRSGPVPLGEVLVAEVRSHLEASHRFQLAEANPADAVVRIEIVALGLEDATDAGGYRASGRVKLAVFTGASKKPVWHKTAWLGGSDSRLAAHAYDSYLDEPTVAYEAFAATMRLAASDLSRQLIAAAERRISAAVDGPPSP